MITLQQMILTLQNYWSNQGCAILQPFDIEIGAGTSHPATFLRAIGPEPWYAAYVQPSRRPKDGRYGNNPNRLQHYYQFQVVIKPAPQDIIEKYLNSLRALNLNFSINDVRFVEDNWENPTLGAWGLGWEVWLNGMEITQFTYFQQVGGMNCIPVLGEITYGLERLALYLQQCENIYDLIWTQSAERTITYGDIHQQNEIEQSTYNFKYSNIEWLFAQFNHFECEANRLMQYDLTLPAYEMILKSAHIFNLLDARGAISVTERTRYIGRIRTLSKKIAENYLCSRKKINFPLLKIK